MNYLKDFYFEKISKYQDDEQVNIPTRATIDSAGYDFCAAETIIIPSYQSLMNKLPKDEPIQNWLDVEKMTKELNCKTSLIPTGIKCHLPQGYYLHLSLRSSCPNKHWLIIANAPGIVDADYYNNPDNEGHIYFQVINLLPFDLKIDKGTKFGQGIVLPYATTLSEDNVTATRQGGFGSTN